MFLDMNSSTSIAEKLGHRDYFKLLKRYYSDFTEAIIQTGGEKLKVFPNEQTNIFYTQNSVSDYQLLIAKNEKLLPDYLRVSTMAACSGFFPGDLTLFKEVKKISPLLTIYLLYLIPLVINHLRMFKRF